VRFRAPAGSAAPNGSRFFPGSGIYPGIFPDFGNAKFPVRPIIFRLANAEIFDVGH
jgi:hypothetical protein